MYTNAEVLAEVLRDAGVQRTFGHPGGEIVVFIDACRRVGIEFVLTGHEASAAFMADASGQLSGVPGVCVATLGPGATNLASGVANAYLDRSPVIAVTAQASTKLDRSFTHQRLDLNQFFAPITKWSVTLDGHGTQEIARRAVALSMQSRRGPVHLALPSDLATKPAASPKPSVQLPSLTALPTRPDANLISQAGFLMSAARYPAVIVGLGARSDRVGVPLRALLDRSGIPFLTTPKAKGIVDEAHPQFVGIAGGMAGDAAVLQVLEKCDLLIGVGFDPVECDKDWFTKHRWVVIDDADLANHGYRPAVQVIADIAQSLEALTLTVSPHHAWTPEMIHRERDAVAASVRPRVPPSNGLSPHAVLAELRKALPAEGVVVCDVGSHKLLIGQVWPTSHPLTFLMSNGLSSMGFGLSAATAAQLLDPERPVLCVTGDGGFLMVTHLMELLVRRNVPLVVAVFTDQTLAAIKVAQHRRELPIYGVEFGRPDYAGIAGAFGALGHRVETLEDVGPACTQALSSGRPVVLDIPIDGREYLDQM